MEAVLAEDTTETVTPPEFDQITFSNFGIEDGTYEYTTDANGYLSLTLNVSRLNTVAQSLYEKQGFRVQTSVMKKNLR